MTNRTPESLYPSSPDGATSLLGQYLQKCIGAQGPLSFATFMAEALYHPTWGYYSNPQRTRVGREGDFITSVSVGKTFGSLLAARLQSFWRANHSPSEFHLLEPGPESGQLALDLLAAARTLDPNFHEALHYHALEPHEAKRPTLQARFAASHEPRLAVLSSAPTLDVPLGAVLANEIIDALPVHLIEWHADTWLERRVTSDGTQFQWTPTSIQSPELARALPHFPHPPEDGYQTEVCLEYSTFLTPLATVFENALHLFIDYGHTETEYYHPTRRTGTLQSFRSHRATDAPLLLPGSQDLTAHVNFTRLARLGRDLGLRPSGFTRQERYLTALAEPLFASLDPNSTEFAHTVRQFRTLTHPSMLGGSFFMLELLQGTATPCPHPFQFDPHGLDLLELSPPDPPNPFE